MASRALEIPTQEQCFALTDEQCRRIQELRDPEGLRTYKNWELQYQPELIRLYMTMLSFPHIEQAMRSRLDWSYKTYANRFKDWRFPVDRAEREQTVAELFALVTGSSPQVPVRISPAAQARLPTRAIQRYPTPPVAVPQRAPQPYTVPTDFLFPSSPIPVDDPVNYTYNRASIDTGGTWASESGSSSLYTYNDDTFSNPRSSIATSISSISAASQYSVQPHPLQQLQIQPHILRETPPRHDARAGRWNGLLRVIPCQRNHSLVMWHDESFTSCTTCGFSRWHSLMLNARALAIDIFVAAMDHLRDINRVDYAGNFPIHFLMAAGVSMDYFIHLYQWPNSTAQNVFGQNPLHVLNPRDLGDQLIPFLEWFKTREHPPGLLLTQRDINCLTPLHTLFQQPLPNPNLYPQILKTFPYATHQLRSLDNIGRTCVQMMTEASSQYKTPSSSLSQPSTEYATIQAGITATQHFLSEADLTSSSTSPGQHRYGFHDIARGARGTSYFGFFQCRICSQINAHSNTYLAQLICACSKGLDRNAPDESGMTPAHALVIHERCNNDEAQTPESVKQTRELFEVLIPRDETGMREALHVLDGEGNTLVWNTAIRGLDEVLAYILSIEDMGRRRSMVNCCGRIRGEGGVEREVSILDAVVGKLRELRHDMRLTVLTGNLGLRSLLVARGYRLWRIRKLLVAHGAVIGPDATTRWRIC